MGSIYTMAWFPGLASLGLCPEAWNTLAVQGSLCAESGKAGAVYKLRFRMGGRQQSRYVGKSSGFVEQIRHELTQLQAARRSQGRRRRLIGDAKQCLRRTKRELEPLLPMAGCAFHGRMIRRRRPTKRVLMLLIRPFSYGEIVMDEKNHEVAEANVAAPQPHKVATAVRHQGQLDRRTQRLDDLTAEALEEPDALRATVKAATAQLLDIGYRMGDEIKANLGSRPAKPKAHQDGAGTLNTFMLVHRQITRYVQLDQQWTSEKASNEHADVTSSEADDVS
jgi:hypothetical protein